MQCFKSFKSNVIGAPLEGAPVSGPVTSHAGCCSRARALLPSCVFSSRPGEQHARVQLRRDNDGCLDAKSRMDISTVD